MTVNIWDSALSIPESLDSLKVTHAVMHRIHFELVDTDTWYSIMKEARLLYGKNWRAQPHVKRRLSNNWARKHVRVWFDVPDVKFGTWVAVKLAVRVIDGPINKTL
jgi:hypothetical protein